MGAMVRQVLQVKRKNSTKCNCPEARLTVVGSVASRFGPRDVATGWVSTDGVAVKSTEGCRATSGVAEGILIAG